MQFSLELWGPAVDEKGQLIVNDNQLLIEFLSDNDSEEAQQAAMKKQNHFQFAKEVFLSELDALIEKSESLSELYSKKYGVLLQFNREIDYDIIKIILSTIPEIIVTQFMSTDCRYDVLAQCKEHFEVEDKIEENVPHQALCNITSYRDELERIEKEVEDTTHLDHQHLLFDLAIAKARQKSKETKDVYANMKLHVMMRENEKNSNQNFSEKYGEVQNKEQKLDEKISAFKELIEETKKLNKELLIDTDSADQQTNEKENKLQSCDDSLLQFETEETQKKIKEYASLCTEYTRKKNADFKVQWDAENADEPKVVSYRKDREKSKSLSYAVYSTAKNLLQWKSKPSTTELNVITEETSTKHSPGKRNSKES